MLKNRTALLPFLFPLFCLSMAIFSMGCRKNLPADERIPVVMRKYSIDPSEIRVKAGERVELDVTTADVQHGFDVPELDIRQPVQPGRITVIHFTAPAKGEYRVSCGVICGPHHDDMTGKLVVQ